MHRLKQFDLLDVDAMKLPAASLPNWLSRCTVALLASKKKGRSK